MRDKTKRILNLCEPVLTFMLIRFARKDLINIHSRIHWLSNPDKKPCELTEYDASGQPDEAVAAGRTFNLAEENKVNLAISALSNANIYYIIKKTRINRVLIKKR